MLKIKNLSVKAGRKQILEDVSLNLRKGKVQVFMGPNGSGKTTLAQTLAGMDKLPATSYQLPADKAVVMLDGKNLLAMSVDERAKAGLFVSFQNPVNVPGVKVFDFLRECFIVSGRDSSSDKYQTQNDGNKKTLSVKDFRHLVLKEAGKLELNEKILDRDLNHFSGGERKRLEMLQALLFKPRYIIFDEIDSGVDIDGLKLIKKSVKRLQKNGAGILLITHQPRILEFIKPSKIHILIGGKIVKSGNSEILKRLEISGYKSFYCVACEYKEVVCPKQVRYTRHSEAG